MSIFEQWSKELREKQDGVTLRRLAQDTSIV
jgi:hypothetical protein